MAQPLTLGFYGGTGTVTGANFLLQNDEVKLLVDCGMVQGVKFSNDENRKPFPYDPKTINYLLVTHAHIDHIGRIPKLVRDGFTGTIISTPETKAIAEYMFEDALKLLLQECASDASMCLYEDADARRALALWETLPYHEEKQLSGGFRIFFKDAGHILGSAMVEVMHEGRKIVFTGDLGNSPTPILKDTETITDASYLIMESVYGDRNHEEIAERREKLKAVVLDVVKRKGALVIPSFSLEKAQVLIHELNWLSERNEIPAVPVFVDSPLAIKITEIYRRMRSNYNAAVKEVIAGGDEIFNFPRLSYVTTVEESKAIAKVHNPKIIIAGSGMSNGGRIIHHERNYISDPKSTILFVGYQAAGSLGRQIQEGAKKVSINGETYEVKAKITTVSGYSSHKDSDHLLEFVSHTAESVRKVFVVMGEPKASLFLVQRLKDYLGVDAVNPELGQTVTL